jgi:hypothetical protein
LTRILVKTPVKDAEILMDGILLGPANSSLDATSGTREITLQAKGYRPRRVKIAVTKNVENVYEIDLEKLPAKTDPKASEREKERERAKAAKLAREREKEKERARKLAEIRKERKEKVPPVLPAEDESAKNLSDPGPAPKKESLEMDAEKGPPAAASTAAAEPVVDIAREPVSLAHFLPLGVGQFYNGDYLLGTLFLGTQLYAGAVIVQANQDIQQAENNEQAAIRRAQVDPTVSEEDLLAFSQAKQAFVKDKEERLNLAIGAAAGTYVFGVLHALIMRPYVLPATVTMQLKPTVHEGLELHMHWDF